MNQINLAVLDDLPGVGTAIEDWLATAVPTREMNVYASGAVASLEADLRDETLDLDLVIVDLVLQQGAYGGLKAIELVARIRPELPVVVFSAMENHGDRMMYGLAATAWFPDQVKAIHPKAFGNPDQVENRANDFARMVAGVLTGTHQDPILALLEEIRASEQFAALLDSEADLARWRAVLRQPNQGAAVALVGGSAQAFRTWESRRVETLDALWDSLADTALGGEAGWFSPPGDARSAPHTLLREFTRQQYAFFTDPYLDDRFGTPESI